MVSLWEQDGKLVENAGGTALLECADCPCAAEDCECCSGDTPLTWTITIAGVADKAPVDCADCTDWNTDHTVTQDTDTGVCYWTVFNRPCDDGTGSEGIILFLTCDEFGVNVDLATFDSDGMPQAANFLKFIATATATIDCIADLGNIVKASDNTTTNECDWSNATANASSV